jgi:hypothetical protein
MRSSLFAIGALPFALGAAVPPGSQSTEAKSGYIVVLNRGVTSHYKTPSFQSSLLSSIEREHHYNLGDLQGFSASLTASQANALEQESDVRIEINTHNALSNF